MPVIGTRSRFRGLPNIVSNYPSLPIQMEYGSIEWSLSLEGYPSASLEYKGVRIQDLSRLESAYRLERKLTLAGIPYIVSEYSYDREFAGNKHKDFDVYSVSVSLQWEYERIIDGDARVFDRLRPGATEIELSAVARILGIPYRGESFKIEIPEDAQKDYTVNFSSELQAFSRIKGCYVYYGNGVELRRLNSGGGASFRADEIITDGTNTIALPDAYKNAELTFGGDDELDADDELAADGDPGIDFRLAEPQIEFTLEEDENPESPPAGSEVLRGLDSNCRGGSGPTKSRRRATYINGVPDRETLEIWGFCYTAEDIHVGDGLLFSSNPQNYWKKIEEQRTTYWYARGGMVTVRLQARDPNSGKLIKLFVHPDYNRFMSSEGGSFQGQTEYLLEVRTRGWRVDRFHNESEQSLETLDDEHPFYDACQFQTIPKESKTAYNLVSALTLYGDAENSSPVSVEWVDYNNAPRALQDEVRSYMSIQDDSMTPDGKIGVVKVDPNFAVPYLVMAETTASSSFAYMRHPEATPENPEIPLITGEETYNSVIRSITSPNKYTEKHTEYSSQDSGFERIIERVSYKDVLGRPPGGQSRNRQWEQSDRPANNPRDRFGGSRTDKTKKYLVTTDFSDNIAEGGSISLPQAKDKNEAKTAIETELRLSDMGTSQQSKIISWFYPGLDIGTAVTTGKDRFSRYGTWRIVAISHTLEFNGRNNKYRNPICTTEGTNLTLGLDRNRRVTIKEEEEDNPIDPNNLPGGESDPELLTDVTGGGGAMGAIFSNRPNRRRFTP